MIRPLLSTLLLLLALSCTQDPAPEADASKRFSWLTAPGLELTGIDFSNDLTYTDELNPYTYRNFYNGGGVGIGDFDNNGLVDIYFAGNLVQNKLYLNQGNFRFQDVTATAGVAAPNSWSTGVAIVDVNADGLQDIYVCKAGPPPGENIPGMTGIRHNELFVNRGDGSFDERAAEFGLDVVGLSVHAAFFDYDGDGDLDCYLLNNSTRATTGYDLKVDLREVPDTEGGNKLFQNQLTESGKTYFKDVTSAAGIYSSAIGFGLGVTIGDVDLDGWPDIFVSNDYFERDYLYYNKGDGTFREALTDHLPEISKGSMGADLADLNNDGLPELFVTEMLPAGERRYKTKAAFDGWNRYQLYRDKGYHQQFSRNVLQLNRGNGNFSEIGRMAGVEATDWSWGALLCDLDNDGLRDIFVANGTGKDLLDQDYINFNGNPAAVRRMLFEEGKGITDLIDQIPSEALANATFRNRGDMTFEDVSANWGLDQPTFSNGSAYADLDNDGDLDLVVNNVDGRAGIYRNNSLERGRMIRLAGSQIGNPDAIGSRVMIAGDSVVNYAELHPMRGFQSTVDKRIHTAGVPHAVNVTWPDGNEEKFYIDPDSIVISLQQTTPGKTEHFAAKDQTQLAPAVAYRLTEVMTINGPVIHRESPATDFDRDPLLFLGINNEGPALATADFNGDGLTDIYLGGGSGYPGQLLQAREGGTYQTVAAELMAESAAAENVDASFFDADGDGDPDLYVSNGSNQFGPASMALQDKLYLNLGDGKWSDSGQPLPLKAKLVVTSCVRPQDFDGDGDLDLFIGGRLRPGLYGVPTDSYLLRNDGRGNFSDAEVTLLKDFGMVTDAVWLNIDGDPQLELAVAAEWGPLRYIHFDPLGVIMSVDTVPNSSGLWNTLAAADLDGDGTDDLIAGNHGLNSRLKASVEEPLRLYVNDFDRNGKAEHLVVQYREDGRAYPLVLRDDLIKQLPSLRKSVPTYIDYQGKTMEELFSPEIVARSIIGQAVELRSVVVLNQAGGPKVTVLPGDAQFAPVYAIATFNTDRGLPNLLLGGNQSVARPELGIYGASFASILINTGEGNFMVQQPSLTGVYIAGDVRRIAPASAQNSNNLLIARSDRSLLKLQVDRQ